LVTLFGLLAAASSLSCRTERRGAAPERFDVLTGAADATAPVAVEESGEPELVELVVAGFRPAIVFVPADRGRPQPLLVAAHGAGDTPHWQCEVWQRLTREAAFILCPRGVPFSDHPDTGYFFRNHHEVEKEVLAGIDAVRAEFRERVDAGAVIYTGYSQGATMGALMAVSHADVFQRLILVEGGSREWNVPIAKRFAKRGGARVLFACGVRHCKQGADRSAEYLNRGGVPARVEYAAGAGHIYDGAVAARVAAALPWLVEGDARWEQALADGRAQGR
jgi:poly(3-hydroxybutyrate) depolymerase